MTMYKTQTLPNSGNVTRVELENGITVLVYPNPNNESVVIGGSLHGGSLYESAEKNGLAAMTSTALMRGTINRDFDAIHQQLEENGADINVNSGMHKVGFNGKALSGDAELLFELLNDLLRHPIFPDHQVERLRGEFETWLKYQQQDTRRQASRAFRRSLYPDHHPYHRSSRGTVETIQNITKADMQAFHEQHYGPRGMMISVVGNVGPDEAVDLVRKYFADWENPHQPDVPDLPNLTPLEESERTYVNIPGKTQSDIVLGVVGPSRFADDYQAASLANSILGQFGMMGRIGDVVREQSGMAYYAYSRLEGGLGPGAWHIAAGVNPSNIERAIELSIGEIRRIATELVEDIDLKDNQSYFTGRLPLQLESNEGIVGVLLTMEGYDLGLDYLLGYDDMINSLTHEDLLAAVQHYWSDENFVIAIAGPETE